MSSARSSSDRRPSDPVVEAFKRDIDRSLLRENLKLTPVERLYKLQSAIEGILVLRAAHGRRRRSWRLTFPA